MMAKQLDGRWCDPQNISIFMDLFDDLEAHQNQYGEVTLQNNPLTEAQMEWLNEFLADFMIDVKVFMESASKIMADALTAMADGFRNVADSLARAQKDGRTRAFGSPAVAFQAPPIPTLVPGVQSHGFTINVQEPLSAPEIARIDQSQGIARRRRFE